MVKNSLIAKKQARTLKELGFNKERFSYYFWVDDTGDNSNKIRHCISVPTVDEVIDWLRRKHNIIIYNKIEPFVDPADQTHKTILFKFGVKQCDTKHLGWNGRTYIGETRLAKNVYSLKREAISIAIKYIVSDEKKKSTKSTTTKKQMRG